MFKTYNIIFMKRINFRLLGFFVVFIFAFSNQVLSGDILIRRDGDTGSIPMVLSMSSLSTTTTKTSFSTFKSVITVSADVIGSELFVDFGTKVGTAYVSVVDMNGSIVYQTAVDTYSTQEVTIPLDGLSSGKYSVKIAYGSTKLIGDFKL